MVYSAYKNYKLNSFLVFLFSSKDFNDATRRIAYMRRYNRMREQKAARIDSTAASLGREVTDLQNKKSELEQGVSKPQPGTRIARQRRNAVQGFVGKIPQRGEPARLDDQAEQEKDRTAPATDTTA